MIWKTQSGCSLARTAIEGQQSSGINHMELRLLLRDIFDDQVEHASTGCQSKIGMLYHLSPASAMQVDARSWSEASVRGCPACCRWTSCSPNANKNTLARIGTVIWLPDVVTMASSSIVVEKVVLEEGQRSREGGKEQ
jgi:hypothetical protein